MSIARSVGATAASRVYLTVLGLAVLPAYLHRLGAEAYGLVALFVVLQVWFQLLDMGLGPTLAREVARYRGGALDGDALAALLGRLERALAVALLVVCAAWFSASAFVAERWLRLGHVEAVEAQHALRLMAACVATRMLGELYRTAIGGFEQQVWLGACNAVFGTARLLGVLPWLAWTEATAGSFFAYQLCVALLETAVLRRRLRRNMPRSATAPARDGQLRPWRRVLRFSLTMSLANVIWALASQVDKLLLSGMLTLADYAAYTLATSAAGGVLLATGSLAEALVPRLTALQARGDTVGARALYRRATRWTVVAAVSSGSLLAFQAERVLWVWTGDPALATRMAPVLALYAAGNAAMAVAALPYYLQLAQGRLARHLAGTGLMVILLLPALWFSTQRTGAVGAGWVWLAVNGLYLLAWTPVAHRQVLQGLHAVWLLRDVVPVITAVAAAAWATRLLPWPGTRSGAAVELSAALVVAAIAGAAAATPACFGLRRQTPGDTGTRMHRQAR